MPRTFAVRVAKIEALRLLGEAMRRKQDQFKQDKVKYQTDLKEHEESVAKLIAKFKSDVAKLKNAKDVANIRAPYTGKEPMPPTLSLCDEKQLLTMLRADTREVIPVPEGSLLWVLIQGRCTPIK